MTPLDAYYGFTSDDLSRNSEALMHIFMRQIDAYFYEPTKMPIFTRHFIMVV